MQTISDVQSDTAKEVLKTALHRSFANHLRPPDSEMFASNNRGLGDPSDTRHYDGCLRHVLIQHQWQDVQFDYFRVDDDCLFFKDRKDQAEWARWACGLLSNSGAGYYAPAIMLLILEEGKVAHPLFDRLLEQTDPELEKEGFASVIQQTDTVGSRSHDPIEADAVQDAALAVMAALPGGVGIDGRSPMLGADNAGSLHQRRRYAGRAGADRQEGLEHEDIGCDDRDRRFP